MVTMAAKWMGKCRLCGVAMPPGTPIDWTKEAGARHVSPEACAEALANPPFERVLRGPQPELPEERAQVERLLRSHPWKAATSKAYAKLPHEYSLRKHWDDAEFDEVVSYIRQVGYEQRFIGRVWTYYDVGEHQYWTMGSPVPETTLINRAVRRLV